MVSMNLYLHTTSYCALALRRWELKEKKNNDSSGRKTWQLNMEKKIKIFPVSHVAFKNKLNRILAVSNEEEGGRRR